MTLDLIEIKPRLNIKKVILITISILLIIAIVAVSSFFGIRNYYNKLSIIEQKISQKSVPEHKLFYSDEVKKNEIVNRVANIYNSNYKRVFLTFDDGPSKSVTIPILDILKENNVKATFFVLGSNAERYPEIVKRAYQEGHYIANHSFTHVYANIYASPQNVLDEYNRTEIAIKNAIGNQNYNSRLFRFPGGTSGGKYANTKKDAVNLLNQNNVAHLDWNALTADAAGLENVDEMLKYVEKTIGNKNSVVILMHDTGIKKGTSELLPRLIQMLKEKGYVFENIYDLLE
ncbi:MAG TPA: polysaccharide deacetylase [Clostridiaceae bacterium]|jgi:peptidoglycan/xylan/chitin deacetylase (PgdA/CDA1 family)|nr:polysaccharide deacetylase family protein [Clostridia bacterium]HJJ12620.1 polysaccharide deacetylase [Clostridiaceae bacterium]